MDFSEHIHDIAFGFKWDREMVDMIDNEFVTVNYLYQSKLSKSEAYVDELGLAECGEKGHLSKYYSKVDIQQNYGNVYCPPNISKDHYLQGQY